MRGAPRSIPLLRFCVGPTTFAIAAEDVVMVAPADSGTLHIGELLGMEPGHGERRVIRLAPPHGADAVVSFQADSPVDVVRCSVHDLLPLPRALPHEQLRPVMGFARVAQQLTLLLDIPSVIAKLTDDRAGGLS
jgi:hypothetical protein